MFLLVGISAIPARTSAQQDSLRARITHIIDSARGNVGVAVMGVDNNDTLSFNGDCKFPMFSVVKLPLALTVLNRVDKGVFSLDQQIYVQKDDLLPDTWSPLQKKYPQGDISITLGDLIAYTVAESDNNGCDILLRMVGGPQTVDRYVHDLGVAEMAIAVTEQEMHKNWRLHERNWSSPSAMAKLLSLFFQQRILSTKSTEYLWQTMVKTSTGPGRIKGLLPDGTIVAHKTGSSGTNIDGTTLATNDAGIVVLPNGTHVVIVVFVTHATADENACERTIAEIARAVWDTYSGR
jgi:beta-lactamase class A